MIWHIYIFTLHEMIQKYSELILISRLENLRKTVNSDNAIEIDYSYVTICKHPAKVLQTQM